MLRTQNSARIVRITEQTLKDKSISSENRLKYYAILSEKIAREGDREAREHMNSIREKMIKRAQFRNQQAIVSGSETQMERAWRLNNEVAEFIPSRRLQSEQKSLEKALQKKKGVTIGK